MDTHELAWAAGFFDGEGSIGHYSARSDGRPSLRMIIVQVRPEPLVRFRQALCDLGSVGGPYPKPPPSHPQFRFSSAAFEHVQAMVAMLWPWLSEPKREQASTALRDHKAWRIANPRPQRNGYGHYLVHGRELKRIENHRKTHCIHGHPFNEENTYIRPADNAWVCRQCRRDQAADYVRRLS